MSVWRVRVGVIVALLVAVAGCGSSPTGVELYESAWETYRKIHEEFAAVQLLLSAEPWRVSANCGGPTA